MEIDHMDFDDIRDNQYSLCTLLADHSKVRMFWTPLVTYLRDGIESMKIFNHMTLQIFTVLKQRGPFYRICKT